MKTYLVNSNGFVECDAWSPHCWINVQCPDKNDEDFMLENLGVPRDFLESAADIYERPRVDREGEWRLTILRVPFRARDGEMPYGTVPISIMTNKDILLTVCHRTTEMLDDFISYSRSRGIAVGTEADFILHILNSAAAWYLRYLRDINNHVIRNEQNSESDIRNDDLLRMLAIQRTLVFFNTSIQGNEMLIDRLQNVYGERCDAGFVEDVQIELHQAGITAKIYSDILESTMDAFASIISNNVNSVMKKMTAVSVVLMVPTLVASFYGMNVEISYGDHPFVFWLIIMGSLTLSAMLYALLRRIHWL